MAITFNHNDQVYVKDGKMGIGTDSPSSLLHLSSNSSTYEANGVLSVSGGINAVFNSTERFIFNIDSDNTQTDRTFDIAANRTGSSGGNLLFRVQENGNVGIGTTNPEERLHVVGDMTVNNGNNFTTINIESEKQTGNLGGIDWRYRYSTNDFVAARILADSNGNWKVLSGGGDGVAPTTALTVNTSQNVGIGTTSPDFTLDVEKDVDTWVSRIYNTGSDANAQALLIRSDATAAHDATVLGVYADSGYKMVVKSTGNVGIGKTDPSAPLHINGGSTNQVVKIQSTSAPYIRFKEGGTDVGFIQFGTDAYISNQKAGTLNFRTNNTDKMTILSGGNVGIGTTNPSDKLDVSGQITQIGSGDYHWVTCTARFSEGGVTLSRSGSGYVGAYPYKNIDSFTASVAFKTTDATHLGIGFRADDADADDNNYAVILRNNSPTDTEVRVQKRVDGTQTYPVSAVNVTTDCDDGEWHTLTVSFNGSHVIVYVDNTKYIDEAWTDTSFTDPGLVGLAIYDGTTVFSDFSVIETKALLTELDDRYVNVTGDTMSGQLVVDYEGYQIKLVDGSSDNTAEFVASNNSLAFFSDRSDSIADSDIFFSIDNDTKMHIDTSGNVGIGINSAGTKLHIRNDVSDTIDLSSTVTAYPKGSFVELRNSSGHTGSGVGITATGLGTAGRYGAIAFVDDTSDNNGTGGHIEFHTSGSKTDSIHERMRIKSDGNVGIGTTDPGNLLHIQSGSSGFSGTYDSRYKSIIEANGEAYYATYVPDNSFSGIRFNNTSGQRAYIDYYHGTQGEYMLFSSQDSHRFAIGNSEKLRIASNGSLDFKSYGAGGFKGDATYVLGVDSSGNVVETSTSGVYFGTNTSNGTYTNQWQRVLVIDTGNFDSQGFRLRIEGTGNTSGQSIVAEIEFNYKNQNGTIRARTTVNSYGTHPVDKDDIAVYFDTTNLEATFYFKVTQNYTAPIYSIVSGRIRNYAFYSNVIGDDTALASETNDSITSNLKFQGITQDQDSGYVGVNQAEPGTNFVVGGSSQFSVNTQNTAYVRFGNLYSSADIATVESLGDVVVAIDSNNSSTGKKFAVRNNSISGDELMTVLDTGSVGIGVTGPDSFLQVKSHTHYDYVHDLHQKIATFNPSSMSGAGSSAAVNIGNGSYGTSGTENLYLQFLNTHGNYGYPVGWRIKSYTDLDATGANSSFAIQQVRRGNSTSANDGTQPHIDTDFLINQDGNVGIGTDSPSEKLHIRQTGIVDNTATTLLLLDGQFQDSAIEEADMVSIGFRVENSNGGSQTSQAISFAYNNILSLMKDGGNVGIGTTSPVAKLDVNGATRIGGKTTYTKAYASLNTTGNAVAGLGTSGNGASARLVFEIHGGAGEYQRVVYSCYNASGNWYPTKVIDEGTNAFDVTDSGNGTTVTFTFKARTASQAYTPYVTIEHVGAAIDTSYL